MTEQIPRLWAWDAAKELQPDLKALISLRADRRELSAWQKALLGAAGIAERDITTFKRPVHVDRLLAGTSLFSMPSYVHPDLALTWDRIGDSLAAPTCQSLFGERIFVSRKPSPTRECHNASDVERLFADHGFDIIYPEDLDLRAQVATFRNAKVVAGFGGSGMFSIAYCDTPIRIILLVTDSYRVQNEYMISSVRGHTIDQVTSIADIPQPPTGWSRAAFHSGFTFDMAREGTDLQDILNAL